MAMDQSKANIRHNGGGLKNEVIQSEIRKVNGGLCLKL